MRTFHQLETEIERYEKNIFEQQESLRKLRTELEKMKLQAELDQLGHVKAGQWRPKNGDVFWSLSEYGFITKNVWQGFSGDIKRYDIRNVFRTEEDAKFEMKRRRVVTELSEYATDFIKDEQNWSFYWDYTEQKIIFTWNNTIKSPVIYFSSKEVAEEAVEAVGAELVKKYYLGVK